MAKESTTSSRNARMSGEMSISIYFPSKLTDSRLSAEVKTSSNLIWELSTADRQLALFSLSKMPFTNRLGHRYYTVLTISSASLMATDFGISASNKIS